MTRALFTPTGTLVISDATLTSSWNIVFANNKYSGGGSKNFAWKGSYISWQQWRAAGQDEGSTFN